MQHADHEVERSYLFELAAESTQPPKKEEEHESVGKFISGSISLIPQGQYKVDVAEICKSKRRA